MQLLSTLFLLGFQFNDQGSRPLCGTIDPALIEQGVQIDARDEKVCFVRWGDDEVTMPHDYFNVFGLTDNGEPMWVAVDDYGIHTVGIGKAEMGTWTYVHGRLGIATFELYDNKPFYLARDMTGALQVVWGESYSQVSPERIRGPFPTVMSDQPRWCQLDQDDTTVILIQGDENRGRHVWCNPD